VDDAAEEGVFRAENSVCRDRVQCRRGRRDIGTKFRAVVIEEETEQRRVSNEAEGLDGDFFEDFVEVGFGKDHLGGVDEAGERRLLRRNWSISQASSSNLAASEAMSTRRASSVALKASTSVESDVE